MYCHALACIQDNRHARPVHFPQIQNGHTQIETQVFRRSWLAMFEESAHVRASLPGRVAGNTLQRAGFVILLATISQIRFPDTLLSKA